MKCHDMRHQIREIGRSKSLNSEVIDEMEKSITLYDTMVKTGTEALDVILSEKSLLCYRKGIVLTCVADGGRLDFMSATDLYSLFGNALDNAIAAVKGLPEEMRVISVVDTGKGDFVNLSYFIPMAYATVLLGWYETEDFSGKALTQIDSIQSDMVLYAKLSNSPDSP